MLLVTVGVNAGVIKVKTVQITLTERCNLSCVYCYEHMKDTRVMSLDVAKDIILRELKKFSDVDDHIQFEFHGGEILLEFELLKNICEWMWKTDFDKPYTLFGMTNGTMMKGAIAEWFFKNKDRISLGVSFDGTPKMQDINRSKSGSMVDLNFFKKCWPHSMVKMTLSPNTIENVYDGVIYLHSLGFDVICNMAYGMKWPISLLPKYKDNLMRLVEWYLSHPEMSVASVLSPFLSRIGYKRCHPDCKKGYKWCGVGEVGTCYSPSGLAYPCQCFMPSTLEDGEKDYFSLIDFYDHSKFVDPKCVKCPLLPSCATCCAHNYFMFGKVNLRPDDMCKFRQVELYMAAVLWGQMLQSSEIYLSTRQQSAEQLSLIAMGVLEIQKAYKEGRICK